MPRGELRAELVAPLRFYLHAYESVPDARTSLGKYIEFYNRTRPHSSLKGKIPHQVHVNTLPEKMAA